MNEKKKSQNDFSSWKTKCCKTSLIIEGTERKMKPLDNS